MKNCSILLLIVLSSTFCFSQAVEWADSVTSYSSFSVSGLKKQFGPAQILGKPSKLPATGTSAAAWAPATDDGGPEFIEVRFKNSIYVQQVAIAENFNPGAITEIILIDASQKENSVYSNPNPTVLTGIVGRMFYVFFKKTNYPIQGLRLKLNTAAIPGSNQIDAIAIGETSDTIRSIINTIDNPISNFEKENLGANVNSTTEDLAPYISPDGKTLYFTRQGHPQNIPPVDYQDLWYSTSDGNGGFNPAINIGAPINNNDNSAGACITPDGQRMLVLNTYKADGTMDKGVSISQLEGEKWAMPVALKIKNYYNNNQYGEYFLTASGKILLMTCERDDTEGSKDIYVSFHMEDGSWSEPKHAGNALNTAESESSPFLAADEKTLYFSTKGHPGYGNNDMFVSYRLDDTWTNWSEPLNLGSSINTDGWDAYFTLPANGEYAYFVSYKNSMGGADVFRQKLPASAKPKPVILLSGRVLHAITKNPLKAKIVYENLSDGKIVGEAFSDSLTGKFKIILPVGKKYGIIANKNNFFPLSENLDVLKLNEFKEISKDLLMMPIEIGSVARLNNIFFDFNKSALKPDSDTELNRLISILKQYPTMEIEIHGHTDNVGTDVFNLELSNKRAKSVYDYLVSKGISPTRLKFKGYGESKLIVNGNSEEANLVNRRVEFAIVKK